jgi:hypothetical protein
VRPNYRALTWAWAFGLDVDTSATIRALEERAKSKAADGEQVLALAANAFHHDDAAEAIRVLEEYAYAFDSDALKSKRALFILEARHELGQTSNLESALGDITEPADRRSAELVLAQAAPTPAEAIDRLKRRWDSTGDAIALLVACELARNADDWNFLSENGQALFDAFKNENTARFALYGAYNSQNYTGVLSIFKSLESTRIQISSDLLRINAMALERLGDPASSAAFDSLIALDPTDQNLYLAGYARLERGDYAGVASLGQRVAGLEGLTPRTAFAFAQWIRPYNSDLAKSLWRRAMALGTPPDELVLLAFHLAHELGLSAETSSLQEPMTRLGLEGKAGITLLSQEDAIKVIQESATRSATLFQQYRRGELPVHMFCAVTNARFDRTHVLQPRMNIAASGTSCTPIHVRHGGRPIEELSKEVTRPYFDVTSFLLAADLGIIDEVTDGFNGLRISDRLVSKLADLHGDTAVNDDAVAALSRTIRSAETGQIMSLTADTIEAALNEGLVVIDWDMSHNVPQYEQAGIRYCSPGMLLDSMIVAGSMSSATAERVRTALGNNRTATGTPPMRHDKVLLRYNVASIFAEADAFAELESAFSLYLDADYIKRARIEKQEAEMNNEISRWLGSTIDRLREKLADGSITQVACRTDGDGEQSLDVRLALSMFSPEIDKSSMIVVDDRYFTGNRVRDDGVPIVSLWDALRLLLERDKITIERFDEVVSSMRRRGLMYIPVTPDEIVRIVDQCRVLDDALIPTDEMRSLARYIALALLDTEPLYARDINAVIGPAMSQAPFLIGISLAVRNAMQQVLVDDGALSAAKATWINDNLSVDGLPGFGMSGFFGSGASSESTFDSELAAFLAELITR